MLIKADLKEAKWVGTGKKDYPVVISSQFNAENIKSAVITVGCFGTFRLFVNGQKVTDELFLPLNTDFEERFNIEYSDEPYTDELSHRLYCPEFNITEFIKNGNNKLEFYLAPGFYEFYDYGTSKICWKINIINNDNTEAFAVSDTDAVYSEFYVTEANMITGETHDFTKKNCVSHPVNVFEAPDTPMYIQDCPSDRLIRTIKPVYLGNNIYDAGEVFTGYPVIKSNKAQTIKIRYSELLNADGTLDEMHIYDQHTDYITDDKERILYPEFTWLCFRYFEVIGDCEVIECAVTHADVNVSSSFECSDEILNYVYKAYIRTQLANMHCGIPSDCPHTERRGYTGDGQLTCAASMMQLDAQKFYKKWIADIVDCQDKKTGHIQYTAPFVPSGGGPGGWGCAIVMVPYEYYKAYGDKSIFEDTFDCMLKWFDYMDAHSENDLVTSDLPGVWCLGDWCAPTQNQLNKMNGMTIPQPFVNTYFFIKAMENFLDICDITGRTGYKEEIETKIAVKKNAIIKEYFNETNGDFADNEQGADAFAVDIGLGDERTFNNIIKHYTETKQYDTGIFGTDILTRILFEKDNADLAFSLLTSKEETSYYTQIMSGATTLLEYWNGVRSQCHPMFGAVTKYLFEYILGIRQVEKSAGYEKIVVAPACFDKLKFAKGKINTIKGEIAVDYTENKAIIEIPENVKAVFILRNITKELNSGKNIIEL